MRRLQRRLLAGRPSVCASMLWLFSAACAAPSHGEWDPRQCADGIDNDADGRIDCDDPDCWAFVCDRSVRDAGTTPVGGAGAGGMTPVPPPGGSGAAGASGRLALPDEDAGMMAGEDAGTTPPPECSPLRDDCGAGRECLAGHCRAIDITGTYVLTALSAVVPARTALGNCFDPDVWCSLGPCDGSCLPDPYVVVTRNSVVRVGTTSTLADTLTPSWKGLSLELQLSPGDTLLFAVWDADTFSNSELFNCSPQLQTQLRSGKLRCTPSSRTDGAYAIEADIERR